MVPYKVFRSLISHFEFFVRHSSLVCLVTLIWPYTALSRRPAFGDDVGKIPEQRQRARSRDLDPENVEYGGSSKLVVSWKVYSSAINPQMIAV